MCRFLAYLGPPVTLRSLVLDPPHSLLEQSYAPRHLRSGRLNADGFGVGWYDLDRRPEPALYRTARPLWADRSFPSFGGLVASGAVLAAVRSATPPSPVEESNTPPFAAGPWLFAFNGAVDGFREGVGLTLRGRLSHRRANGLEGTSDSEVVFALLLDQLDAGAGLGLALSTAVSDIVGITTARLNLVVTDGRQMGATAYGNSLFLREGDGAVVLASEPYDDDERWREVPDTSVVLATGDGATVAPLWLRLPPPQAPQRD